MGYDVVVEKGGGVGLFCDDSEAGALIVGADEVWGSEVVLRINPPTEDEICRRGRRLSGVSDSDHHHGEGPAG
ncbi:hypothetical protein ACFC25_16800 [Pseudarthrobacter sp. NPDC055928]|uniref:hypothetical protein n=1 Tax=Pseudarthrobacter sp. NPDC055928 TaxID=3345661 RepID=UPI0035DE9753